MSLRLASIALAATFVAAPASASLIETYMYSVGGWGGTSSTLTGFFSGTDINGDGFLTIDAPDPATTVSEIDYLSITFPDTAAFPALTLASDLEFGVGYQEFTNFGDYAISFSYELGTSDGLSLDFYSNFGVTDIEVLLSPTGGALTWIDYFGLPDVPDNVYRLTTTAGPIVSKTPLPPSIALGGLAIGALAAVRRRKS